MHSKDFLAQELRAAGLGDMADKAAEGYYHDFLSPLAMPEMQLANDLAVEVAKGNEAARKLRERHFQGEFDATLEESDEWAESDDGKAAFAMLTGRHP